MPQPFNRRDFLTGVAGTALAYAIDAPAQTTTGPRTNITVRIDRDLAVLDPAGRTGPWDGNVIRVVQQRLMKQKPNSSELELDAAAEVKQVSPTVDRVPPEAGSDVHRRLRRNDRRGRQVLVRAHRPAGEGCGGNVQERLALPHGRRGQEQVRGPHRPLAAARQSLRRRHRRRLGMHRLEEGSGAARRGHRHETGRVGALSGGFAGTPERRRAAPQSRLCRAQAVLRGDRDPLHLGRANDRSRAALRRARLRGAVAVRRRAAARRSPGSRSTSSRASPTSGSA